MPSLVSIRNRLDLDELDSTNSATNLLFALLCLMAFDTSDKYDRSNPRLKRNLQLAISSYGQEFIFSPPTHRDSVVVCLLLADYRPTAVVFSPRIAHKAIKSTLYLNIAYSIADRLEILPSQLSLGLSESTTMTDSQFEHQITDSLQGLKILSQDLVLDGLLSKPVCSIQTVLDRMVPHIDSYRNIVKNRPCSVKIIFQIQWAVASYTILDALKTTKENWRSAEKLCHVIEEVDERCMEQIRFGDCALTNAAALGSSSGTPEELLAARAILEQRFHAISTRICGLALLYVTVLKSRSHGNGPQGDPEIYPRETIRMGTHVSEALKSAENGDILGSFILRFGTGFPDKLLQVLEMFLKCTDLELDGVPFQAPFRDMILNILVSSKGILENNTIHVKLLDGKMKKNSDYQMEVMAKCAKRIENMVSSPGKSVEAAFAGGCVYAASIKVVRALLDIMENLKKKVSRVNAEQDLLPIPEIPSEWMFPGIDGSFSWDTWDMDSNGLLNPFDPGSSPFDWSSVMNFDEGMDFDLRFDSSWT